MKAIEASACDLKRTDRHRGGNAFVETRTGAYYGKLGYLAGLGRSSVTIAEAMGDGIHPAFVRTLLRRWGIEHRPQALVMVPVTAVERCAVNYRAEQAGLSAEEWLYQVISAVAKNNLYDLVVTRP